MSKHSLFACALMVLIAGFFAVSPAEAGCQAICIKTGPFCWECADAGEETGAWCTEPAHCICMLQQCFAGGTPDAQATPGIQLFAGPSALGLELDLSFTKAAATPSCGAPSGEGARETSASDDKAEPELKSERD